MESPRAAVRLSFGLFMRRARNALAALICLLLIAPPTGNIRAQRSADESGWSKKMRMAIQYYEKGNDLEAMDGFMHILVKGSPLERPAANEYLNRITERMALYGTFKTRPLTPVSVVEKVPARLPPEAAEVEGEGAVPSPLAPRRSRGRTKPRFSRGDRVLMKKEIDAKIRNRTRVLLGRLRKYEDLRVGMANSRLPRAVGIPTDILFGRGTQYKKDSADILKTLTRLIYSLGATQVIILPENAIIGDSKIMDLRRTMAISSHFIKEGIAPARIRVNLLSDQVDIPRGFLDYRGLLLLFVYNQPLNLTADNAIGADAGPPMSLGVSPAKVDPLKNEGVIIEFSVTEPQAGLMSWRFELLGPGPKAGDDMVKIQEVKGGAPVFHQIFWNGRRKYFGKPLPGGRYECVLTATDMRNRTRKRHAWITVEGPRPKAPPAEIAKKKGGLPPADLLGEGDSLRRRLNVREIGSRSKDAARRRRAKRRRDRLRRRRAAQKAKRLKSKTLVAKKPAAKAAPEAETQPTRAAAVVNYQVVFVKNTATITPDGESILTRVADTMQYYPLDNINLVGYAHTGERDSQSLASRRADLVSRLQRRIPKWCERDTMTDFEPHWISVKAFLRMALSFS